MPLIKARKTRFGDFFWNQFNALAMGLCFHTFTYDEVEVDPDRSLLMIGNHISWWDGFWPHMLNRQHLGKRFHVMMLEAELRKRRFMTRGGAFSMDPQSRSVVDTLRYTHELLENPANMVVMYPQGRIESIYHDQFSFEKGMSRLLCENRQVLLAVALLDYGVHPRPSVHYGLKLYNCEAGTTYLDIQHAFQSHYLTCISKQKEKMG